MDEAGTGRGGFKLGDDRWPPEVERLINPLCYLLTHCGNVLREWRFYTETRERYTVLLKTRPRPSGYRMLPLEIDDYGALYRYKEARSKELGNRDLAWSFVLDGEDSVVFVVRLWRHYRNLCMAALSDAAPWTDDQSVVPMNRWSAQVCGELSELGGLIPENHGDLPAKLNKTQFVKLATKIQARLSELKRILRSSVPLPAVRPATPVESVQVPLDPRAQDLALPALGSSRNATPPELVRAIKPGEHGLKDLVAASPLEFRLALKRIEYGCSPAGAVNRHERMLRSLIADRDKFEPDSPASLSIQETLEEHVAAGKEWDQRTTPFELLDDQVAELLDSSMDIASMSAASMWNIVALFALVTANDLSGYGVDPFLQPWERTPHSQGRLVVADRARRDAERFERAQAAVREIVASLLSRRVETVILDELAALPPLARLYRALQRLVYGLNDGAEPDARAWKALIAQALGLTASLTENWPAGACTPVATMARDTYASPLPVVLARLQSQRDASLARTLTDAMHMLEGTCRPLGMWPLDQELPLPAAITVSVAAQDPQPAHRSAEVEQVKLVDHFWIDQAVKAFHSPNSTILARELSRLVRNGVLPDRRDHKANGSPNLYNVYEIIKLEQFEMFEEALLKAIKAKFQPQAKRRNRPRGEDSDSGK